MFFAASVERADGTVLKLPEEFAEATAFVLKFFNDLFDSINGDGNPSKGKGTPLRDYVSADSVHHDFWEKALQQLKLIRLLEKDSLKTNNRTSTLKNWSKTISGFQKLWKILEAEGFQQFKARNISQDILENYFSRIKALGMRDNLPTCWQFEGNFRSLLISDMSCGNVPGANCEATDGHSLFNFTEFIVDNSDEEFNLGSYADLTESEEGGSLLDSPEIVSNETSTTNVDEINDLLKIKVMSKIQIDQCEMCKWSFRTLSVVRDKKSMFRGIYPALLNQFMKIMTRVCYQRQVKAKIIDHLVKNVDPRWVYCDKHRPCIHKTTMEVSAEHFIELWCNKINQNLCGKAQNMPLNPIFARASEAFQKKLKRKRRDDVQNPSGISNQLKMY